MPRVTALRSKALRGYDKERVRLRLREKVIERFEKLADAQLDNAEGIKHLMLRDPKTGKFERVTKPEDIDAALKAEGEAVWIYTKDPSVQAFTDLMNRTIDKPPEQIAATVTVQGLDTRIRAARKRI